MELFPIIFLHLSSLVYTPAGLCFCMYHVQIKWNKSSKLENYLYIVHLFSIFHPHHYLLHGPSNCSNLTIIIIASTCRIIIIIMVTQLWYYILHWNFIHWFQKSVLWRSFDWPLHLNASSLSPVIIIVLLIAEAVASLYFMHSILYIIILSLSVWPKDLYNYNNIVADKCCLLNVDLCNYN